MLLAFALTLLVPAAARGDDEPYFYKGYDYGTQSLFSPMTVLLNRGFDTLQIRPENRYIWRQPFMIDGRNVVENLADPFDNIDKGPGWGKFVREEILPLRWGADSGRWVPNYAQHLIGGGVTYTMLREWFKAHEAPVPAIWAVLTLFSSAFINEMIENRGVQGPNSDALADLYVFDVAGVILFSFDDVNEFFSKKLIALDWSLQPAFSLPKGEIHNQGNYYAAKIPTFVTDRVHLFAYGGISTLFGLSYKLDSEYSLSLAGGARLENFRNSSLKQVLNVVSLTPAGAIFVDRNNSLLGSLQISNVKDYFIHLNVYPNAFFHSDPGFGFWTVIGQEGQWLVGLSMTRSFGFGLAGGTL